MTQQGDLTPLDVLLQAMRDQWKAGDYAGAVAIARIAAPYVHPRQRCPASAAANTPALELHRLSDAELARQLSEARGGSSAPSDDPDQPG